MQKYYIKGTRRGRPGVESLVIDADSPQQAQTRAEAQGLHVLSVHNEQEHYTERQLIMEAVRQLPSTRVSVTSITIAKFCLVFTIVAMVILLLAWAGYLLDRRNTVGALLAVLLIVPSITFYVVLYALIYLLSQIVERLGKMTDKA